MMKRVLLLLAILFVPTQVFGAGFLVYQQDAKAQGMGLAVTSSIDNPSAIFYNPSLLPDQPGFGVSMGDTIIFSERSFTDAKTGIKTDAKSTVHNLPTLFAKYTRENLSFGVGVYSLFGLSSEWPSYWVGKDSSIFAELKTSYINPVIAYKFNDIVSIGFGVSFITSSVTFKTGIPGYAPVQTKLTGDGNGVGVNAAVTFKLPKDFNLAFTYRSGTTITYTGNVTLPPTGASTRISLPYLATGGLSKKFGPLTLGADLVYSGWSCMNNYTVQFDNGYPSQTAVKKWSNSFSFGFGANYQLNKSWEFQAGYFYDQTPVPKSTLTPDLPDASRNLLTAGVTYSIANFKFGAAYQATFFDTADSTRTVIPYSPRGKYDSFANIFLVNAAYYFK
jgi:long-chain fatty acid transport protein